ncbi:MAG TPA: DNA repair protein RadA [Nitriliruptorales bacterium]|nr:DNA repair protein RadA [Nitriliruptorales bacterium]
MAGRNRTVARCSRCGHQEPRWVGRCPGCHAWGTLEEHVTVATCATSARRSAATVVATPARPIGTVPLEDAGRIPTGCGELDRVLGGGVVPGTVGLLGGEPGVGKSTLLLQAAQAVATAGHTLLYVSGEESASQLRLRAERLGALSPRLLVAAESSLPAVLALLDTHAPAVVVVDSIQTIRDPALASAAGSTVQVRECAAALVRAAKSTGRAVLLVGHVTKDGAVAGPRVLEHIVDVVVAFEGERHHALRLLRTVKNRFGPAGEIGCFEMAGDGLREVADPSRLFLAEQGPTVAGIAVTITVEGPRPLAVEVQALAAASNLAMPRRQASGLDASRVPLMVAVLDRRAGVPLAGHDLFASAVGGIRLREPAADLALCLAIASSRTDRPVPCDTVTVGEVGLAGEVRIVPQLERRLAEAARLGFAAAVVPAAYRGERYGLRLHPVRDVRGAVATALHPDRAVVATR